MDLRERIGRARPAAGVVQDSDGPPGARLSVVFVLNSLGPSGTERSIAAMLPEFPRQGIAPLVICLERKGNEFEQEVQQRGTEVRFLPQGVPTWQRVQALRRIIKAERPALIHTMLFDANMAGRLAALGTGVPVLTSVVNTSYAPVRVQNDPNLVAWKHRLVQAVDAVTSRLLTTHFHAVTAGVKEAAAEDLWIAPERITVVERGRSADHLGAPGAQRRQRVRKGLGLGAEDEVVLNVGRQEYQKGQVYLLEAMRLLASERPRLVLLVAGREGAATSDLEEFLETHPALQPRVRFLGHRDDVPDLLAAADVFAFPSLFEGTGGAVIEAMAMGLPVVTSDIATMREVVGGEQAALLAAPRTPEAFAEAIRRLLDNPERAQELGRRARVRFQERFTLERSVRRMADLYRRVARNGVRTSAAVQEGDEDARTDAKPA